MFSSHKHGQTIKTLGMTCGGGAFAPLASFLLEPGQVDEGLSRPGRCTDHVLVEACGLDAMLEAGYQSLADKGFLMRAYCTAVGHELITPWKKRKGHLGLGEAGSKQQDRVGNCSIHVERAFAMVQHCKMLRRRANIRSGRLRHRLDHMVTHVQLRFDLIKQ